MIELKRDPKTGQLIGYEDGIEVGPIWTFEDYLREYVFNNNDSDSEQ